MKRRSYIEDQPPTTAATHQVIQMACRIVMRFPKVTPTPVQLQDAFGMHRATAYRWVAAMKAVRGDEAEMRQNNIKGNDNG